jgi:hypothetical protein
MSCGAGPHIFVILGISSGTADGEDLKPPQFRDLKIGLLDISVVIGKISIFPWPSSRVMGSMVRLLIRNIASPSQHRCQMSKNKGTGRINIESVIFRISFSSSASMIDASAKELCALIFNPAGSRSIPGTAYWH